MKLLRFIPSVLTICMVLGILFGFYIKPSNTIVFSALGIGFLFLVASYIISNKSFKQSFHFSILSWFLFFVIGIAAVSFQNIKQFKNHYSHHIIKDNSLVLKIDKELKSNSYYHKYNTSILQLNQQKVIGKTLLNIRNDSLFSNLKISDRILIKTDFKKINEPLNLYQFNYRSYLEKQQIYHQVSVTNNAIFKLPNNGFSINGIASDFRKKINTSLKKYHFKQDELAIINALLLGQRNDVSKALLQSYAGAGAMHILAVSGLHIGILLLLLNLLFKPIERLKNGKIVKLFIVVSLLWLYAIIAGFSPSIIRAVSMFTAIAIGLIANKKTNTLHNLFISLFFLLLIHPLYIFSVGFQMSYLAVFSIVYMYPLFIRLYNPEQWFVKKVWQLFAISFSAQLGILPLSLYYFHQFPGLFFISSLVIIPLLGFILGFGILVIMLSLIGILPQFLADFYSLIIQKMNAFIAFIAQQEFFLFKQISVSTLVFIGLYGLIIFGFRYLNKRNYKKLVVLLLALLFFQGIVIYEKYYKLKKHEFIVFNKSKHTIINQKIGDEITIFHTLDSAQINNNRMVSDYITGIGKVKKTHKKLGNTWQILDHNILLLDSLGIYNVSSFKPQIVILTQSPKINLKRLITKLQPKIIIADGSNYKSYKKLWKTTCMEYTIDFHDTSIDGAFVMRY